MNSRLLAVPFVAFLLFACSDDDDPATPTECPANGPFVCQTSPDNVLHNLRVAYGSRSIGEYTKIFTEDFLFVADSVSVEENPDIPPSLDVESELQSARNLFSSDVVEQVTLSFDAATPVAAEESDELSRPFPPGTVKVIATVSLAVEIRDLTGGENNVFCVDDDIATFFLYPHPTQTLDGSPVWYLFEWRDRFVPSAETCNGSRMRLFPTIEVTWTTVKDAFLSV